MISIKTNLTNVSDMRMQPVYYSIYNNYIIFLYYNPIMTNSKWILFMPPFNFTHSSYKSIYSIISMLFKL